MWPLSTRALASLGRSHTQSARIDVLHDGGLVKRLGGQDGSEIPVTFDPLLAGFVPAMSGTVNVSRNQIRRDGSVSFLDLAGVLEPDDVQDLFAPFISEIRPWIGIHYWDATPSEIALGDDVEWIPLATLVVHAISGTFPAIEVSGFDRLSFLQPFVGNYVIANATPTSQALFDLLTAQIPTNRQDFNISTDNEFTTPLTTYTEQDASLDAAHDLALSMGLALYADPMGKIIAAAEPTTDDMPSMTYQPGPTSMMLRPQRNIDASNAHNVFVFTGEQPGSNAPVRGVAMDLNPNSLTYVDRIGERPFFDSSPLVISAAQAQLAANTSMRRNLGIADTIAVPIVPNPALESGDVIQVVDNDQGINFPLIVDAFSTSLRASDGGQTLSCRSRVVRSVTP